MINRRTLIAGAAALAATPAFAQRKATPIGIQLYTVRTLFEADPVATLEKVARIGYKQVEFGGGGYDSMDAAMLRRTTDKLGLAVPSAHISYDALKDRFAASLAMAKTLGVETVVVPYLDARYRNEEAFREVVATVSRIAKQLRAEGLGLAYHNHDFEFTTKPGGVSLYDRLVRETDPALVKMELDLYWAIKAGEDPQALIRRLPGRIYAYHVKDMTADGAMTSVGAGRIDFAAIFRLNRLAGVKRFYVENDESPAPYLPDITTSYTNLTRLLGRA